MTRSSFALKTLGLGIFLAGSIACGGDKPPPKEPESTPSTEDAGEPTSSGGAQGDAGATAEAPPPPPPPAAAALALPAAAAKLKVEGKKKMDVEIKSDGSVSSGGKPAAKLTGMELHGPDGKAQLKVDSDGNITTADGAAYAKFEGDDLAAMNGAKWSIGDDGALSSTDDKGKKTPMGKSEGVGAAKRASLLTMAFLSWGLKAPAAPAVKKKPGEKPAAPKKP